MRTDKHAHHHARLNDRKSEIHVPMPTHRNQRRKPAARFFAALVAAAALVCAMFCLAGCADTGSRAESASTTDASQAVDKPASTGSTNKGASSTAAAQDKKDAKGSSSSTSAKKSEKPNRKQLNELIGEDDANALIKHAKTDEDAAWIAAHPDAYAAFRPHIQEKSLRLAAHEPLAAAYVRGLPEKFPNDDIADENAPAMDTASPSSDVPDTAFPHLYQWDLRWGYTMYDGDAFGLSGCGPTAMAMVYQGLYQKHDKTPYYMGQLAFAGGFVAEDYSGTQNGYFAYAAEKLKLNFWDVEVGKEGIMSTLEEGHPLIASMGPGTFSQVGHYIVLAGKTKDGKIIVNDPYSVARSGKLWDADLIASEANALYALCLPD